MRRTLDTIRRRSRDHQEQTIETIKALKTLQKNHKIMDRKLDKMIERDTKKEVLDAAVEEEQTRWLQQVLKDSDVANAQSIAQIAMLLGSTVTSTISLTSYVVDKTLSKEAKEDLARKTRTDYVTIEHYENNCLMTEFYQNRDDIDLFHVEQTKPWYKFW